MIWSTIRRLDSSNNAVSKFVFQNETAVAESVLYKYPTYTDRTVICCSTQSGCPIGCRFCGSGDSFVRSLTAEEIVAQPHHILSSQIDCTPSEIKRLQIMFMSMGEPMLNLGALIAAMRTLHKRYPTAALLVSTSAPNINYTPFMEISKEIPAIGLQFSVHESTDEARNQLIPFAKKLNLAGIAEVGERWHRETGRSPFFNYCVHDKNNTPEDVQRLRALFNPAIWNATISVICEREESVSAANIRQRKLTNDFMSMILAEGYNVRLFDPAGQDDVGGGCGQLWFVQQWMKEHPELSRPSAGNGLYKVHTPQ